MNAREYYGYPDFLGDLDALLVEDSPTLEELEVQAFGKVYIQFVTHTEVLMRADTLSTGRRVTGHLDGAITQQSTLAPPPTYSPGPYPHRANSNNSLTRGYGPTPPDPADRLPPTSAANFNDQHRLFEFPEQMNSPVSPIIEIPSRSPSPQPLPKYVMELHIITKAKAKGVKAVKDFTIRKPPRRISLSLTYLQFLEEVAKAAEVDPQKLDHENMCWKHRRPASASPTNISEDESYSIMIQATRLKKEEDRWIIVEMGKPLISEAVGIISLLDNAQRY